MSKLDLKKLFEEKNKIIYVEPTILVDTSYLVYFTAHSAWSWYKREFDMVDDYTFDPMTDVEFKKSFEKKFRNSILYSVKNAYNLSKTPNLCKVIFAQDCPKRELWRNELYPEYKLQRRVKDKTTKMFDYNGVFTYVSDILIPNFLDEFPGSKAIRLPTVEADDIIATISKILPDDELKMILASDHDFGQLLSISNMKIIDIKGKELTRESQSSHKVFKNVGYILSPKEMLLMKILMGDKSDNIKGIFPRLGEATAAKLILEKDKIKKHLEDDTIKEQFSLNRNIIDFDRIPKTISEAILESYNGKEC